MLPRFDDVRHMKDENLAPFHRNRRRFPRKQLQHECSSKANRQLVKRNPPSSSGGLDLRISSPNTFTPNGSKPRTISHKATLTASNGTNSCITFIRFFKRNGKYSNIE
ncbi:unnamed protein product [Protopolystoma xenopodis]|uniref:Uncharacterized protein n=1 Tax=Protopolystoma xenopodis TaxID=117903 RepID=A0A3S4ZUH2_9PLAT|nr:unnamed protein product [Protopolystoma xenopodis]